jgi:flagellar hook-associated protein 3 FlgL
MHNSMNGNSAQLGKIMQQLATNKRMLLPSDDPIASVRVMRVQREEASLNQYNKNIDNISASLSTQEANLKSISDAILNVRDRLLWAANGANTSDDLAAIAGELESLEKTLFTAANVRDEEGRYLFSGTLSDTPAVGFDAIADTYFVSGNDKYRQAAVANGVLIEENVNAIDFFGAGMNMLNELHSVVATLKDPALDASNPAVGTQIRSTIDELDVTHKALLRNITELGGRQNTLTLLGNNNEEVSLVNQRIEGELSQLDYAGATIDLNNYQLALQATQKTYLKINQLSLFSLL